MALRRSRSRIPVRNSTIPRMMESFSSLSFMWRIARIAFGGVKELEELYQQ
jgi:hypothetical protein